MKHGLFPHESGKILKRTLIKVAEHGNLRGKRRFHGVKLFL
jgi:hypothetical protein